MGEAFERASSVALIDGLEYFAPTFARTCFRLQRICATLSCFQDGNAKLRARVYQLHHWVIVISSKLGMDLVR
jgi:hypothetical protein